MLQEDRLSSESGSIFDSQEPLNSQETQQVMDTGVLEVIRWWGVSIVHVIEQIMFWLIIPTFIIWITVFFVRKELHKKVRTFLFWEIGIFIVSVVISAVLSRFILCSSC